MKKIYRYLFLLLFLIIPFSVKASTTVFNFSYTGNYQTFTVPVDGIYKVQLWGASGGDAGGYVGGNGAYTSGNIELKAGDTIYIYVGAGGTNSTGTLVQNTNFNGGGYLDSNIYTDRQGGGATDIRYFTSAPTSSDISWNSATGLRSRIMVAAGGGGGAYWDGNPSGEHGYGGAGGTLTGNNSNSTIRNATGGTQISGGIEGGRNSSGGVSGAFGVGGSSWCGGSGGSGYYGGGGNNWMHNAGAGGSSYISGYTGCVAVTSISSTSPKSGCTSGTTDVTCSYHYTGMKFTNTSMIAGNASMPTHDGSSTMTGNDGNGYASITLLQPTTVDYVTTISVSNATLSPSFASTTYSYDVLLDSENSLVDISAPLIDSANTITGVGTYSIPSGASSHSITITNQYGYVQVYTINFYRPASSYKYLKDITIDGTSITGFSPEVLTYNITASYKLDTFDLEGVVARTSQTVYGNGTTTTKSGNNQFIITVVSEDGKSTIDYTLNIYRPHSSKLKTLKFGEYELNTDFNPEILTYSVTIPSTTLSLDVTATPYDEEATTKATGFGYINMSGKGTIIVTEPNSTPTTYTIVITKEAAYASSTDTFGYTGTYQEYIAPATGTYEFEVWGAQGGGGTPNSSSGSRGGAGGYSVGYMKLKKDQVIYVYVGGAGSYASSFQIGGGYNGGGGGGTNGYGGGGATDIRIFSSDPTDDDLLWNSTTGLGNRIIVAGGGGGADNAGDSRGGGDDGSGGAGGGLTAEGAWISGSLYSSYAGTQTSGNALGIGASATSNTDTGGAGGGYYGGLASNNNNGGAGGGSGYISETLTDAKTVVGTSSMPTHDGNSTMVGNTGNGYAKITLLPAKSENNYLTSITAKVNGVKQTYTPTYDMTVTDYYLTLTSVDTTLTISARPEDSTAIITGLGDYLIPAGTTDIPITVTAENGSSKTYTLHVTRPASSNQYPTNIEISGLVTSLCAVDSTFCIQDPKSFSSSTNEYYMTVPARIKQLYFTVTKGHYYQKVVGDGKTSLKGGENVITIEVTSEDGTNTAAYTYYITRNMDGDTDLSELSITDPAVNINYDPDITSYYLSVPNDYTSIKGMTIKTDDTNATYTVTGNDNLIVGSINQVYITVTAANGEVKTYILNVYREKSGNTYLGTLSVTNGTTTYDLTPTFNKIVNEYNVTVPNDITSVDLNATTEVTTTSLIGTGTKTLSTGDNKYSITTTAEDGSTEVYSIDIYRNKNSNDNLSAITVKSGTDSYDLNPTFNSSTLNYDVTVKEGITSIDISSTTEVSTSITKLLDNSTIKVGTNVKRIMVIAEDGTNKTYTLNINRPSSTDAYLSNLTISNGTISPEFNKETNNYSVTLENDITSLTVTGIKNNTLATVKGNGNYDIKVGTTSINIVVTSESGVSNTYVLNVTRKPNTNALLSSITTSEGVLVPTFDGNTLEYSIDVKNSVTSITVTGTPLVSTTKVVGNNTYTLNTGDNTINLITTAEDGTTSITYKLVITRDKSDNANISSLYMEEGVLSPTFSSAVINYTTTIPYDKTSANFHVTLEDSNATYKVSNNTNLVVGDNTVTITVTSVDGTTKDYTVIVTRKEANTGSNYLSSLTTNEGTISPSFNKDTSYYTLTVDYSVSSITLNGVLEDSSASMTGNKTYNLNVGNNLTYIRVTSSDGKIRDYQVLITRKPNTDARLSSLVVSGSILSPNFDKDTTTYSLTTTDSSLTFDEITTYDSNATYKVIGNSFETNTNYVVTIVVTAEDKVTTSTYTLNVTKNPSNNNNLSSLSVEGYTISPTFSKTTTVYTLSVSSSVNNVIIDATSEDSHANIIGTGSSNLVTGENQIVINVTSESGKIKVYTIVITKAASTNNYLDSLILNNGTLSPTFSSSTTQYNVTVPYDETSLDMEVSLADVKATYIVTGNNLIVGTNTVNITVTSESGSIRTYSITVIRDAIISSLLSNLKITNYNLVPDFNSNINNYSLVVDNEITELGMNITTLDPGATYKIAGNSSLVVGDNVITITVTSRDSSSTTVYTLNVKKQAYSNSYLDYLYTNLGDLTPAFAKGVMEYTLDVNNATTSIEIFGEAVDGSATVTGVGTHTLSVGANKINVVVKTTSGITRTYYVTVNRSKATDNYLNDLVVSVGTTKYTLTPEFDKLTNNYTLTVPKGTSSINLTGTVSSTATVSGLGNVNLKVGDNTIKVNVTSESGDINTYTIVVTRPASSVNHLISLIPSAGTLSPDFGYNTSAYTIDLDSSVSSLSFMYDLEDSNSTVTGTNSVVVTDGTSTRTIVVTAEDGTTRTYTITVNKARTDIATLASLSVTGYNLNETFSSSTYEYTLTVPNSKQVLTSSEVVATATDSNAKISKTTNLSLSTTDKNIFTVTVTAPDGFTKEVYYITVTRTKSSTPSLSLISVSEGSLTPTFNSNTTEYEWKLHKIYDKLTSSMVTATTDGNSVITMPDSIVPVIGTTKEYPITVTSEDGTATKTYTLKVIYDLSSDASINSLKIDKGYFTPTFNKDTLSYDVYEYTDTTILGISATTSDDGAIISSGTGYISLSGELFIDNIVVTAEDGTTKTYVLNIHRTISTDKYLSNISLNGTTNLDCSNNKCVLNPTFVSDTLTYKVKVPYEYTNLDLNVTKMNDGQTVKYKIGDNYITTYTLPVGLTNVLVEVYDGMDTLTSTYKLAVTRSKSNIAYLSSLSVDGYTITPTFNKNTLEYSINVETTVTEVKINATAEDSGAYVKANGYNYLEEGDNIATVSVTAPDGTLMTYIIHIIKASLYNSHLKSLTVSTGTIWDLSPTFKDTIFNYTTSVPSIYENVTINAIADDSTSTIVGDGVHNIVTGMNTFKVTVTATDGSTSIYTLNVTKETSKDVNLSSLSIKEGSLSPDFEKGITKYTMKVGSDITNLTITATTEDPKSSYIILGNGHLITGTNIVDILVYNEDRTASKTYQITVSKDASSNAFLSSLILSNGDTKYDLTPIFNYLTVSYNLELPDNIDSVTISGTVAQEAATATGFGTESLDYGNNEIKITVIAEDGTINVYTINIYRKYDLTLKDLKTDEGDVTPLFDPKTLNYTLDVTNDITSITVIGLKNNNNVVVTGNGNYPLISGENIINIKVTAPDETYSIYQLTVNRIKNSDSYLSSILIHEGTITPEFTKDNTNYEVHVKKNITSLTMDITPDYEKSTYVIKGNENFVMGSNKVEIIVTAEDSSTTTYTINAIVEPDSYFSNKLSSLSLNASLIAPDFNADINYYTANVSYSDAIVYITATPEVATATVTGTGGKTLVVGRNVNTIKVTGMDGTSNTYTLVIYRKGSNDASLKSLSIDNYNISPTFTRNRLSYTATVGSEVTDLGINAIGADIASKIEISGNTGLVMGVNVITIKVTAPDGTTTKTYTLTVTKATSTNNYLSDLSINGYTLSPSFVKTNTGPYSISVDNNVNSIVVNATKEVSSATITGAGKYTLVSGSNIIKVNVTSEAGDVRTYSIVVTKSKNSDATLSSVAINDGIISPTFSSNTTDYNITVDENVTSLNIRGITTSSTSNVTGNGVYELGTTKAINLVVTAEDNTTKTYTFNIVRGTVLSSKISSLLLKDGVLSPEFNKYVTDYVVKVPNDITSLNMVVTLVDSNATYKVTGNTDFVVGNNTVTITVTSSDSSNTTAYNITVIRESIASNYLKSLDIAGYALTPEFDRGTLYYEINVPTTLVNIDITAVAEDSSSTITGNGTIDISSSNKTYLTVTSSGGITRTYTVAINKIASDKNLLLSLASDIGTFDKTFVSSTNQYILTVPIKTKKINLTGTSSPNATVVGLGSVDVVAGSNIHNVIVTSESGNINTYAITINRPGSNNTNLTSLTPSSGTIDFSNSINDYTMEVIDSTSMISFSYVLEDSDATITGTDLTTLNYGDNKISIVVKAEDGTTRTINITVIRMKEISSITTTSDVLVIAPNETKQLTYTLSPTDTSYTSVNYTSSNTSVVSVDDKGIITGVKAGTGTVVIASSHNSNVKTTVSVIVLETKLTSTVYEINRNVSGYEDYVIKVPLKLSISDFISNFDNESSYVEVYNSKDTKITDLTTYVGTGMTVKLNYKDKLYDTLHIVVIGDLDGDGISNSTEVSTVSLHLLKTITLTDYKYLAADVNRDSTLDSKDLSKIKNYNLKKINGYFE